MSLSKEVKFSSGIFLEAVYRRLRASPYDKRLSTHFTPHSHILQIFKRILIQVLDTDVYLKRINVVNSFHLHIYLYEQIDKSGLGNYQSLGAGISN